MSNIIIGREINLEGQYVITANNFAHLMLQRFFNQHNAYLNMLQDGRLKLEYENLDFINSLNTHLQSNGVDINDPRALDYYPETVEADPAVLAMQEQIAALRGALKRPSVNKILDAPVLPIMPQQQDTNELPVQQPVIKATATVTPKTTTTAAAPRSSIFSMLRKTKNILGGILKPLEAALFGSIDPHNRYEDLQPKRTVIVPPKVVPRTQVPVQPPKEKDKDPFTVRFKKEASADVNNWISQQQQQQFNKENERKKKIRLMPQ